MEEASENAPTIESLQSQVAQRDALLSKLQDEVDTYKFQVKIMRANNNMVYNKNEALTEEINMLEKESRAKSEKIQNLEKKLSAIKQRESKKEACSEALEMKSMENEESEGQVGIYKCHICDYETNYKHNLKMHFNTGKHRKKEERKKKCPSNF